MLELLAGVSQILSADWKMQPSKQGRGILRHGSSDDTPKSILSQESTPHSKESLPATRSGNLSRSGSLQRVVSFEDEIIQREDLPSRSSSLRSSSLGESRSFGSKNDLATVREVPGSEWQPAEEDALGKPAKPVPGHARASSSGGPRAWPNPKGINRQATNQEANPKGFVRHANSQEPRFRLHTEPVRSSASPAASRNASRAGSRELISLPTAVGSSLPSEAPSRSRSGRLEGRRNVNPSPRSVLDEREDKWEKEAARLKLLEQHMRSAITPRGRAESAGRRPAEAVSARQKDSSRGSKPSLEEMLVLIEDARKLYAPGSETRIKLDQ